MRFPNQPSEGGVFEVEVFVDETDLRKSNDPKTYCTQKQAMVLFQAIEDTTVPKEFWTATFSPWAQKHFNLPAFISFGG